MDFFLPVMGLSSSVSTLDIETSRTSELHVNLPLKRSRATYNSHKAGPGIPSVNDPPLTVPGSEDTIQEHGGEEGNAKDGHQTQGYSGWSSHTCEGGKATEATDT